MEFDQFFTGVTVNDPELLIKVGVTHHFFAERRFDKHPLLETRNVYIQYSQFLTSDDAHQLEDFFHQAYSSPMYKNFTLTGFDSTLDGYSELYNLAKPVYQKIIPNLMGMRSKLKLDEKSEELKKTYLGWDGKTKTFKHPEWNICTDSSSKHRYHCMKFYVAFLPIKDSSLDLEIREKKEKAKEVKLAKAAKAK